MNSQISTKDKFRFEKHFTKDGNNCWIWKSYKTPYGYGQFEYKCKTHKSHRFSWLLYKGEIPKGMLICHKCDNPPCVNPDHLWLGTPKENMQDMSSKKRFNSQKISQALKERIISIETRKKMSLAMKGKKPSNLTIEKARIAHKGKKLSEEHKRKISLGQIGRKVSKETRQKISESKKGKKRKPFSKKAKKNMSLAQKKRRNKND
jgi:hypothetical protein